MARNSKQPDLHRLPIDDIKIWVEEDKAREDKAGSYEDGGGCDGGSCENWCVTFDRFVKPTHRLHTRQNATGRATYPRYRATGASPFTLYSIHRARPFEQFEFTTDSIPSRTRIRSFHFAPTNPYPLPRYLIIIITQD